MAVDQTVLFTIIPRGFTVPGDEMPVSVFVAPRLRGANVLDAFPDWLGWTRRLKDAGLTLEVRCNGADFRVEIDTGVLEPDLWEALFNAETPVRSHTTETYEDHGIISFSVRETLSAVKQAWQEAGVTLALPDDPDAADQREGSLNRRRLRDITDGFDIHWDGNLAPRWRIINRARNRSASDPATFAAAAPALDAEGLIVGARDPNRVRAAARDFSVFHHMPTPDRNEQPLPEDPGKDLDFHQVIGALGAFPDLMRRLGLVFDINLPRASVAETPLNNPGTLSVRGTSFGWQVPADTPETATSYLHALLGQMRLFTAAPRSIKDPSAPTSVLGLLALDARRFGVAQVDVDGAMHKAIMLADSVHNPEGNLVPGAEPEQAPHPEVFDPGATLPALRSGGFSLYADRRGATLFDSLSRARANNASVTGGPAAPPFTAEDLVRGYRLDVWDASNGKWRSLHRRKGTYTLDQIEFETEDEEGFVETAATQPAPGAEPADKDLYLHECFARWAGWSLSAPRPGKALSRYADPDKAIPQDGDPEYAMDEPTPAFPMKVRYQAVPGTLPSLRFGRRYRFRARAVDLAGNSLTLDDPIADALARAWALPLDPEGFAYLRYEPVPAPLFAIRDSRAVTEPGSAPDRMVIRTWNDAPEKDADAATTDAADRHLLPPRAAVETAERHGLFDKGGKLDPDPALWNLIGERDAGELPDQEIEVAGKTDRYPLVPDEMLDPLPYLPDPFARGVAIRDLPGAPAPSVGRAPTGGAGKPVEYQPLEDANPRRGSATLVPFGEPVKWQKRKGILLALREREAGAADPRPVWEPGKRLLTVFLPKGSLRVVPVSSFLELEDLKQMGVWQWIREFAERLAVLSPTPDPFRPGADVDRIAHVLQRVVEGGHWMLTPPRLLTLVHAVQQPLGRPAFAALAVDHKAPGYGPVLESAPISGRPDPLEMAPVTAVRALGAMDAYLLGALALHAGSTQKVSLKAEWVDPVDDLSQEAPSTETHAAPVDEIPLRGTREGYLVADPVTRRAAGYYDPEHGQIALVQAGDFTGPAAAPALSFYQTAAPRHQIGDPRRHRIAYTAVATSRFQEYFPQDEGLDFTRASEPVMVDVPASARPLAPDVAFVVPTFGWQRQGETNVHRSVRFGGGLRIYLRRPWFSSGEGELLGVTLWNNAYGTLDDALRVRFKPYITQWGMDPIWDAAALAGWPSTWHFPEAASVDRAVTLEEKVAAPDGSAGRVDVVGFPVEFDPVRGLWYADVTLNVPADAYTPFIRLALTRYQPHALPDAKVSRIAMADFAQLTPSRAALVTTDPHHARTVRVVVSGLAPRGPHATVSANPPPADASPRPTQVRVRVEERDPAIASDLGWNPAPAGAANVQALNDAPSPSDGDIALWTGVVTFAAIPEPGRYRLVIEEREYISARYADTEDGATVAPSRLIYAEIVPLNADLLQG